MSSLRRFALMLGWLVAARAGGQDVPGVTRPVREALLSAAASGIVSRIAVREGEAVAKGQVLIELDRRQEELEVARRKLLWENVAELRAAEARRTTTWTDFEATKALYESTKSVSREELARKQLEYDLASAEMLRAQMNKEREKIEYEMAGEALERRTIRAPFDGRVTEIKIKEGEGCEVRQPLIGLADVRELEFSANVEARVLALFEIGRPVELLLDTGDAAESSLPATISYVSPVVDRASGLGALKATFINEGERIRPGIPARLRAGSPAPFRP